MLEHINRHHKDLASDIRALGWFWGTVGDIMKGKPLMTITEALGEGDMWKGRQDKCRHFLATADSLRRHFRMLMRPQRRRIGMGRCGKWFERGKSGRVMKEGKGKERAGHKMTTKGKKKLS
jgi:hypothetical protein